MPDTLQTRPYPTWVTMPNLIAVSQTVRAYVWSRSLKVIGTDTDRSCASDFLLTFYGNHGLMLYLFEKRDFNAPAKGVPLEMGNTELAQKNRMMQYQAVMLTRTGRARTRTRTSLTVTYCKLQLNLQSLSSNNNEHKVKIHNI